MIKDQRQSYAIRGMKKQRTHRHCAKKGTKYCTNDIKRNSNVVGDPLPSDCRHPALLFAGDQRYWDILKHFQKAQRILACCLNSYMLDSRGMIIITMLMEKIEILTKEDGQCHQHCSGNWENYCREYSDVAELVRTAKQSRSGWSTAIISNLPLHPITLGSFSERLYSRVASGL